jgi:hypothetical protein
MYNNFKGKFTPKNPEKYSGNVKKIIYRSSWERLLMVYCDKKDQILQWSSEEYKIPYVFDGKNRTYYPDFWIEMVDHTGEIQRKIIEIKPHYQKKWKINKVKWKQARKFAKENHMTFEVMTEKELF